MRGVDNRIILTVTLAIMLAGWPFPGWAQGCYISPHGDYICGKYNAPARAAPQTNTLPTYSGPSVLTTMGQRQESLADLVQRATAFKQAAIAAADAFGTDCGVQAFGAADAAGEYTHPPVKGKTFVVSNTAALLAALKNAKAGDGIMLKNGVYQGPLETQSPGVTIFAENKQGAVIRPSSNAWHMVRISHSNTVIKGLKLQGCGSCYQHNGFHLRNQTSTLSNVLLEDNVVTNIGNNAFKLGVPGDKHNITNVVIRNNTVDNIGNAAEGEAFYLGSPPLGNPKYTVSNVEIYGNTVRDFTQNGVDFKPNTNGINVHHNVFEGQTYKKQQKKAGLEGTIVIQGQNNQVHHNVFSNNEGGPAVFNVTGTGGHRVYDNVVISSKSGTNAAIANRGAGGNGKASQVSNNIFGNLASYSVKGGNGLQVGNNQGLPGGVSNAALNTAVDNILSNVPKGASVGGGACQTNADGAAGGATSASSQSQASAGGTPAAPPQTQNQASPSQNTAAPQATASGCLSSAQPNSNGKTYYVAKGGTGTCATATSKGGAVGSITAGLKCLKSGDTLEIGGGTYNESIHSNNIPNGSAGNHTVIQAAAGERVTLQPNSLGGARQVAIVQFLNTAHHVTIRGLDLNGASLNGNGSENKGANLESRAGLAAHDIHFDGIEIRNFSDNNEDAISFDPQTYNVILENSYIHDIGDNTTGTSPNVGVYFRGSEPGAGSIVRNNVFKNIGSTAVNLRCLSGCSDGLVYGNTMINTGSGVAVSGNVANTSAFNNIIVNPVNAGLIIQHDGPTINFHNNTIYAPSGTGKDGQCLRQNNPIRPLTSVQAATVKNNICDQTVTTGGFTVSGNLYSNPSFVNPAAGNFCLKSGSPAQGKGADCTKVGLAACQ